jgi:ketosteroid isomerase-like protein
MRCGGGLRQPMCQGDDLFMTEPPDRLHAKFQDAFNRHDLEAIVELYETAAVLASSAGPVEGTDAIREAYRGFLAIRPTIDLQTLGVNRAGDLAMLHGKWILQGTGPDGNRIRREGRNTETARLQPNGRWLFVIDNPSVPQD